MRISYFNYHYDLEGTARATVVQIEAIARGLRAMGHEVDVQYRAAKPVNRNQVGSRLKGISPLRYYGHIPKLMARNVPFYVEEKRLLERFRPDVVLAVSSSCNVSSLLAARHCRVPFVLFTETPLDYEYRMFFKHYHRYGGLAAGLESLVMRNADQIVCISQVLKQYLMRYRLDAGKLHTVPNGVDHRAFRPSEPDAEIVRSLGLKNQVVVGFVGTFGVFYSVENFARILRDICQAHKNVCFLFVGQGLNGEALRNRVMEMGIAAQVFFTGSIDHKEVPRYVSVMDIVLAPYRGDLIFYLSPMKPLEYMAAGKAVLSPALGQITEYIKDGVSGMLYPWNDDAAMKSKLEQLILNRNLRKTLGEQARKTIEQSWTWEHQVKKLSDVLAQAVCGRNDAN